LGKGLWVWDPPRRRGRHRAVQRRCHQLLRRRPRRQGLARRAVHQLVLRAPRRRSQHARPPARLRRARARVGKRSGPAASSRCTAAHPLHTRSTKRIGASISEPAVRPGPQAARLLELEDARLEERGELLAARPGGEGGNRRVWLLRALRAGTKTPNKTDLLRRTLRPFKRPGRARTETPIARWYGGAPPTRGGSLGSGRTVASEMDAPNMFVDLV
jgi:hypothetical protein